MSTPFSLDGYKVLLRTWRDEVAVKSSEAHYDAQRYFMRWSRVIGGIAVATSAIAGVSALKVLAQSDKVVLYVLLIASVLTAVLSALQSFLGLADRASKHRVAGAEYAGVRRDIDEALTFPPASPAEAETRAREIRQRLDKMSQEAPELPGAFVASFRRRRHPLPIRATAQPAARFLVVDTETGGLDPAAHSLLTLAAVVWADGAVGDSLALAIREPNIVAEPRSLEINRVDVEKLKADGLAPAEAVKRLDGFIAAHFGSGEKPVLAGHNIGFDVGFLKRLYRLAQRDYETAFSHRTVDTAGILRFLSLVGRLDLASGSSTEAFDHFGIAPPEPLRHTALGDALATAALLTKLVEVAR